MNPPAVELIPIPRAPVCKRSLVRSTLVMSINPLKSVVPAANATSAGTEFAPLNVALI
jgi:hypothetical protein